MTAAARRSAGSRPVVCCDLDGVVWRGDTSVPGAAAGLEALRRAGFTVVFVTNNSGGTRADYAAKLGRCGIDVEPEEVLTSAVAAAALLGAPGDGGTVLPPGARVLACAGSGVREALTARGYEVVDRAPSAAVVVGWHRDFDFDRLAVAADAVRAGARFVATNLDPTYPAEDGLLPGNGALVAAVATAAGRPPEVAGKPHAAMAALVREAVAAAGGASGVMVGDRPSTDGAFAVALGWPFALVLTGVAGPDGEEALPDPPPAFVAPDLAALAPRLIETLRAERS